MDAPSPVSGGAAPGSRGGVFTRPVSPDVARLLRISLDDLTPAEGVGNSARLVRGSYAYARALRLLVGEAEHLTITLSACPLMSRAPHATGAVGSTMSEALVEQWRRMIVQAMEDVERASARLPFDAVDTVLAAGDHRRQRTALHYAACGGLDQSSPVSNIVERLLALSPTAATRRDADGRMPLHLAARRGRTENVLTLVEAHPGALLARDLDDMTPCQLAVARPAGDYAASEEVVRVLTRLEGTLLRSRMDDLHLSDPEDSLTEADEFDDAVASIATSGAPVPRPPWAHERHTVDSLAETDDFDDPVASVATSGAPVPRPPRAPERRAVDSVTEAEDFGEGVASAPTLRRDQLRPTAAQRTAGAPAATNEPVRRDGDFAAFVRRAMDHPSATLLMDSEQPPVDMDELISQHIEGATLHELLALQEKTADEVRRRVSNDVCTICLGQRQEPAALPCGHVYCARCIEDALSRKAECPTCRAAATACDVTRLYM